MTELRAGLPIIGFADASEFEAWIEAQPNDASGLWLKLAKKDSWIASLSKAEAIDAALCHGWIDGQLDKYDDACWLIRFTPRKLRSKWLEVNRTRALQLIEAGRMQSAGLAQIEAAKKRWSVGGGVCPCKPGGGAARFASGARSKSQSNDFLCDTDRRESLRHPVSHRRGETARYPSAQDRIVCCNAGTRRNGAWVTA